VERGSCARFTARQREIVRLLAAGLSGDEIAGILKISTRTVRAHTDVLRRKLGVARARLIPCAYRAATGDDPFVEVSDARHL